MTRQIKTPRQRAEAALAVAERRYEKAIATRDRLATDLAAAEAEVTEATALRSYAKQHPALQTGTTSTSTEKEIQS